jgi:hypothetical protein
MSVVCPRSNNTISTHMLTVLSVAGVQRLLTSTRSPLAPHVLKWIMSQVDSICSLGGIPSTSQSSSTGGAGGNDNHLAPTLGPNGFIMPSPGDAPVAVDDVDDDDD